ncbi:hypothetical protein MSG28_011661 [Choristoneura fumiferana]|uniref:Uncharacterized protein n=1 Tax=Choristoneura fumiferana TaxID=7141 RepID=A0ACC0KLP6_CHOFU|nr:hypothetical protein MSG28_011661 [Choristoneura fumiferana]
MSQKTAYCRLSSRIAEEKQLLAEEKWIIDALNKIRSQRNGLQIERLELESLKTQLMMSNRSLLSPSTTPAPSEPSTLDTALKMMTSNPSASRAPNTELEEALFSQIVDTGCNEEALNLTVTNPVLSLNFENFNVEEEDDDASDESQDENTSDNMLIDMNMFMNGNIHL